MPAGFGELGLDDIPVRVVAVAELLQGGTRLAPILLHVFDKPEKAPQGNSLSFNI